MRVAICALATLLLAGCVSTQMRSLIGSPIQEAQIRYGPPVQIVDMPDGARGYQFRQGGGPVFVPGHANTTVTAIGNTAYVKSSGTPGGVVQAPGCLLTFIARDEGGTWTIRDVRVPKDLVC